MPTKSNPTAKLDVKAIAKTAYEKGAAAFGEAKTATKGNLEAVVASGKILGTGLKTLGDGYLAEGKSAIATFNTDIGQLAAVKSPADFFALQSKIFSRNFDAALGFHTKNAQTVAKLAQDSAAPVAKRITLAVDAVRKAA